MIPSEKTLRTVAKRENLRCARRMTLVEVLRGSAEERGVWSAVVCRDPASPTGATAVIGVETARTGRGHTIFLPFGKRGDWRAHVIPLETVSRHRRRQRDRGGK